MSDRQIDAGAPSETPLRIAFVGCVIPRKSCDIEPACSVAANNFQLGLLKGLEAAHGYPIQVISTWTVAMFPRSRVLMQRARSMSIGTLRQAAFVSFLNLPVLKQITMLASIMLRLGKWLFVQRQNKRVVLLYGTFSPYTLAVLAATKLCGGASIAVVTELPFDRLPRIGLMRLLQHLDLEIQKKALRHFDALIPLARTLVDDFAPEVPSILLEGAIDPDLLPTYPQGAPEAKPAVVLYSGAIDSINGIPFLLDAFDLVDNPDIDLHIYGRGPLENLVKDAAQRNPRIRFGGRVPNLEVLSRQAEATVLVLPRPTAQKTTNYSFPSKLMEYMASGRPTIVTLLPSMPRDYHNFLYILADETPLGLATLIKTVCNTDPAKLREHGKRAQDFVLTYKNWSSQARRVYEFVSEL